jgi:hypothetical protein
MEARLYAALREVGALRAELEAEKGRRRFRGRADSDGASSSSSSDEARGCRAEEGLENIAGDVRASACGRCGARRARSDENAPSARGAAAGSAGGSKDVFAAAPPPAESAAAAASRRERALR